MLSGDDVVLRCVVLFPRATPYGDIVIVLYYNVPTYCAVVCCLLLAARCSPLAAAPRTTLLS